MPTGPISSPPQKPKRVQGVFDDDAPLDNYEDAVEEREAEDIHRLADEPNIAAARRANKQAVPNSSETGRHKGTTGSKNWSK